MDLLAKLDSLKDPRELMAIPASPAFQDPRGKRDPKAKMASQGGLDLMDTVG